MTAQDSLGTALNRLLSAYIEGHALALLFDYDGTLAPIVEHPRLAILAPETRRLLERLADLPRVVVAIVSGRSIEDLQEMLPILNLCYAGTNGLELSLRGTKVTHREADQVRERVAQLAIHLQRFVADFPGSWLEQKAFGLTLHYRELATDQAKRFRLHVSLYFQQVAQDWRILDGPLAVEIVPELGWTKGTAVREICKHLGDGVIPLYAGDHNNDAEAFAAAAALGGISIGVGPEAPQNARFCVPDPVLLADVLFNLLESLEDAQASGFGSPSNSVNQV